MKTHLSRLGVPLAVSALLLSTGCSLVVGGSGRFEVEGDTYAADSISCEKREEGILITMNSDAAQTRLGVTDEDQPKVIGVSMGARGKPTMAMIAKENRGRAVVTRSNKTYLVTGTLVVGPGEGGPEEDFKITVTCNRIA